MAKPRLGFVGTGWIGRHRMAAMLATGAVEAAAIVEPSPAALSAALAVAPDAAAVASLDALLALNLDGIVIATPSAQHAFEASRALAVGAAVFCQKPLGRSADEVRAVVAAARADDRLLGVDLSYRFTAGMKQIAAMVRSGELGRIFAVDLVFHNAYGPDKPWFYDRAQSGGGCVIDLGVHLVDLALWVLGGAMSSPVTAALTYQGGPVPLGTVEDHAFAQFTLDGGVTVRLACSWHLNVGRDAEISAAFYGSEGAVALRNVGGSFYDFTAERYYGTVTEVLTSPPDDWGGRAAADWAMRLAAGEGFDSAAEQLIAVADVLDRIYAAA